MKSYKYLDNLCKDMNGIGVTGYIQDMEQEPNGEFYVEGWKSDLFQIKHYRYVRNRIVHENDADENDLCSSEDTEWIDEFYQRIMEQNDPLALCYKEKKLRSASKSNREKALPTSPSISPSSHRTAGRYGICVVLLLISFIAAIFMFLSFN